MLKVNKHNIYFLKGGGEMGSLIAEKDWSNSSLGPIETWPPSLCTSLNIILHSKLPMLVFWGPEYLCFFNDAHKPSLGDDGKHIAVLGEPTETSFPESWDFIKPLFDKVYTTKDGLFLENQLIPIFRNGKIEDAYWTVNYSPLIDSEGNSEGLFVTSIESTQKVREIAIAEEVDNRFKASIKQAPVSIGVYRGPELIVEMVNDNFLELADVKENDIIGKPLFEALPESRDGLENILKKVYQTGETFQGTEFPVKVERHGSTELGYFNFICQALREDNDEISGTIGIAIEVTELVKAKHALSESEKKFRNLVMHSPVPMAVFRGKNHTVELANEAMINTIWRKKEEVILGRDIIDIFPELKDQKFIPLLDKVLATGIPYQEKEALAIVVGDDGMRKLYVDIDYSPLIDSNNTIEGLILTVIDVTENVISRKKTEEAETRLRLATEAAEMATFELDLIDKRIIYSPRLMEIFGHDQSSNLSHEEMRNQIHPEDIDPIVRKAFTTAFETGIFHYEARLITPSKEIKWIRTEGKIYYDDQEKPIKLIGVVRDITDDKINQQVLLESEQKFRLLADSMPQQIWIADPEGNLNYFNQAVFKYSGMDLEEILEKGWLDIIHPDDREENVNQWKNSIETGEDFLFEHRFRRHDGSYHWILSKAIPQRDEEGNIQRWVGASTDIQDQKKFASELEQKVKERTRMLKETNEKLENSIAELQKMNVELQSFAYVSSHDLQEPLRKIQTFISRIAEKENDTLSDSGKNYFGRIQDSANRMQNLIKDLLAYSRTNTSGKEFKSMNLNEIIEEAQLDLMEKLDEKKGVIEIGNMCEVSIIPFQFVQLMSNLISNSIKFSLPGVPPKIKINSTEVNGKEIQDLDLLPFKDYCHITFSDNGIGFDTEHKDKIFEVFQRLHGKNDYEGTGIGLAIVKKIVLNHDGFIKASSMPNKGVTFDIFIPMEQ
ncbi:PAS domain S-box protein [Sediminicola sp. 1XM1-17]|uniref:PAS domain S-box protein n=1 Tax=Sediminicola sp. 1XM1-17 TaxID=3127702 RepID=UPI003077B51B